MRAVILLGSNTGETENNMELALRQIGIRCGLVVQKSSLYRTAPWGNTDQPHFLNQVAEISTTLPPRELLDCLLKIETEMGRVREVKWAPRVIDLDILFYEDRVVREEGLTIPHPNLHERRFTLEPLCEKWPEWNHPVFQKSVRELLSFVPDHSQVELYQTNVSSNHNGRQA